jgi:hypothetical protein
MACSATAGNCSNCSHSTFFSITSLNTNSIQSTRRKYSASSGLVLYHQSRIPPPKVTPGRQQQSHQRFCIDFGIRGSFEVISGSSPIPRASKIGRLHQDAKNMLEVQEISHVSLT